MAEIILAIDPGYDRVGWAIGNNNHAQLVDINFGCIQTNANQSLIQRYQQIITELEQIIHCHQPTQLAIESLFYFKNQKTVMQVSEARGIIIASCLKFNLTVFEYTPLQIKVAATGYGRATKEQVDNMVRLQLKLKSGKMLDDAMDALAILLTHSISFNPQLR